MSPTTRTTTQSEFIPAADLEIILEALGLEVDDGRTDEDEVGVVDCPGHERLKGRRNSRSKWSINRETGYHNCYSCGYGGTLTSLVMDVSGKKLWEALTWIRSFGINFEKLADLTVAKPDKELLTIPDSALDRFEDPPREALESRSLTLAAARRYDVLWNPDKDSWVTPIKLIDGTVLGFQEKNERFFRNRPDDMEKSQTLFGIDQFPLGGTAVLVESPLDCVRIHPHLGPDEGALSSFGVHVSDEQMKLIESVSSRLVMALDNDTEGYRQTKQMITGWRTKVTAQGVRRVRVTNWARRVPTTVWNYGSSKAKDPGEQTDREIRWSMDNRLHASVWEAFTAKPH